MRLRHPRRARLPPPALPDLQTLKAALSLREFVRQAWHVIEPATPLVWGPHLDAVCLHLEAVSAGKIKNLIIGIPPRSSKSSLVSVLWPAWEWIRRPSTRWLYSSYAMSLAVRDSVRCRRVIESPWYQERYGTSYQLTGDVNHKIRFENDRSGHRIAVSVGSAVTGEGADILCVDDGHNVAEAESAPKRLTVRDWFDQAWFNRVNNARTGRRVVVGQRVHHEDLIGHLCKRGEHWDYLMIPEEYEPDRACTTSIGWSDWRTTPGQLLRPERFGAEQVTEARRQLGSRGYGAQYQQRPTPAGGALFKLEWFRRYFDGGDHYFIPGREGHVLPQDCMRYAVCDPAGGLSESADFTAIGVFARTPRNDLLLLHVVHERIAFERIVTRLKGVCDEWRCNHAILEGGFLQEALVREAQSLPGMPPVAGVTPAGKSKLSRALPALVLCEAGQVFLPEDAPWVEGFLDEVGRFTGSEDAHDDLVDCLAYAVLGIDQYADAGEPWVLGTREPWI